MGRVVNPKSHLVPLLRDGDPYFIGFGSKKLTTEGINYRDLTELIKGNIIELEIRGVAGPLAENIKGRRVRKQPERKIIEEKHIKYTRKDGTRVEYKRLFNIWEKEQMPGARLKLTRSISPLGEIILHFRELKFDGGQLDYYKEKLAMNICNQLAGYYELYHPSFEPIVKITATLEGKVLSRGVGSVRAKLEDLRERLTSGDVDSASSYRFASLQNFKITDVYDGEGGFSEYFQFEFKDDNIVVLENLKDKNASYIFKLSDFERMPNFDKSTARNHPAFLERLVHHDVLSWEGQLKKYLRPL